MNYDHFTWYQQVVSWQLELTNTHGPLISTVRCQKTLVYKSIKYVLIKMACPVLLMPENDHDWVHGTMNVCLFKKQIELYHSTSYFTVRFLHFLRIFTNVMETTDRIIFCDDWQYYSYHKWFYFTLFQLGNIQYLSKSCSIGVLG